MRTRSFFIMSLLFGALLICSSCLGKEKPQPQSKASAQAAIAQPSIDTAIQNTLQKNLKNALEENAKLTTENSDLKNKLTALEDYARAITGMSNSLKSESETLRSQVDNSNKRISELEGKLNLLQSQNNEMAVKISDFTASVDKLSTENKAIKERLEGNALEKENKEYRLKLKEAQDRSDTAINELAQAIRDRESYSRESAILHYNLGYVFFKDKDYNKAIDEFKRSIELDPLNADAYYNLGVIYDDYLLADENAIAYYKKFIEVSPKRVPVNQRDQRDKIMAKVKAKILQAELRHKAKITSVVDDTLR